MRRFLSTGDPSSSWESHYDELAGDSTFVMFQLEARDYVSRLRSSLSLEEGFRVMDFGCGFGFVAEHLARLVERVWLWDSSARMRETAQNLLGSYDNVVMLRSADDVPESPLDMILVNSVVQYMAKEEFLGWLIRWQGMLAPNGRIVVSDILPESTAFAGELLEGVAFAAREGALFSSFFQALTELRRYRRARRRHALLKLNRRELTAAGAQAGLAVEFLPHNLTHRRRRTTAVFTVG